LVSVHFLFSQQLWYSFLLQSLQIQTTHSRRMAGVHIAEGYQAVPSEPTSVSTDF
jgi:hypothetical protein